MPKSKKGLLPPWGSPERPAVAGPGRPKGSRNAKTIYEKIGGMKTPKKILDQLKANGIELSNHEIDEVLAYATAISAISGNGSARREYNNRRFGQAPQDVNLNANVSGNVILNFEKKPRQNG